MRRISADVLIAAEPEEVWSVLTDFGRFPEWNPFIVAADGGHAWRPPQQPGRLLGPVPLQRPRSARGEPLEGVGLHKGAGHVQGVTGVAAAQQAGRRPRVRAPQAPSSRYAAPMAIRLRVTPALFTAA
ncbi:SRPBCC family protein [Streptomyces altiplanensis]